MPARCSSQRALTARGAGLAAEVAPTVEAAVRVAVAAGAGRVLVCGSLYLAGHVLRGEALGGEG